MPVFKAIIVGGGPAGMVTAHALHRAGIDYVLFEKRQEIAQVGALTLWPNTVRLFHQLGLLEKLEKTGLKMQKTVFTGPNGKVVADTDFWALIEQTHGYPCLLVDRVELMNMLVETLPNHEQTIQTGKKVAKITTHGAGVVVDLEDGSTESGSIIIGADGVWSKVRQQMSGGTEFPYVSAYNSLWGRGPPVSAIPEGTMIEHHEPAAKGTGFNVFGSHDCVYYIAYRACTPTKEHKSFDQKDAEAFAQDIRDITLVKGVKFGDIWEHDQPLFMTQLHHGIAKKWHGDRTVLTGDAVHKVMPNAGAGANVAFESAASLVNHLRTLLQSNPNPTSQQLTTAFATYQAEREVQASTWVDLSLSRLQNILWTGWLQRFIFFHLQPRTPMNIVVSKGVAPRVAQGRLLDFVPFKEAFETKVPWVIQPHA